MTLHSDLFYFFAGPHTLAAVQTDVSGGVCEELLLPENCINVEKQRPEKNSGRRVNVSGWGKLVAA